MSRFPRGWIETAIGGAAGTAGGGALGLALSSSYVERRPAEGFEDLGTLIVSTVVGAWLGAVLGVFLALKLMKRSRPVLSGFLFALLGSFLLPLFGRVGTFVAPESLPDGMGSALLWITVSVAAAVCVRLPFDDEN